MRLYTKEELRTLREYDNLQEALKKPDEVICLRLYHDQINAADLNRIRELRYLQTLSITMMDVSALLSSFGELSLLQELAFQRCEVNSFPQGVLSLRHLRSLSISNDSLRQLPDGIGALQKLEELRFSQNALTDLPITIGALKNLNTLVLSYNRLERLPESIGDLRELEALFLDCNSLTDLPESLWNLSNLKMLALGHNKLPALAERISNLQRLESLGLEGNAFESLPRCLGEMPSLKRLEIEAEMRPLFMDWTYRASEKPPRCELTDLRLFVTDESSLLADLRQKLKGAGLSDFETSITSVARDAIRIETTKPDDYSTPSSSRMGGFPDLLHPGLYPITNGAYWIFLAQINLADIAPLNNYLPRTGLLSFFVDSTESLNGRVLFHEGDLQQLSTVRHGGADEMLAPEDDYTETPHRLKFTRFTALPHEPPGDGDWSETQYKKYDSLSENFDHHINGYTFTQHESPQEQAAAKLAGSPQEWVPLLQVGFDKRVGFCFWDAGTLTFCIHQEDLRRNDFSRVHVSLESS